MVFHGDFCFASVQLALFTFGFSGKAFETELYHPQFARLKITCITFVCLLVCFLFMKMLSKYWSETNHPRRSTDSMTVFLNRFGSFFETL